MLARSEHEAAFHPVQGGYEISFQLTIFYFPEIILKENMAHALANDGCLIFHV